MNQTLQLNIQMISKYQFQNLQIDFGDSDFQNITKNGKKLIEFNKLIKILKYFTKFNIIITNLLIKYNTNKNILIGTVDSL